MKKKLGWLLSIIVLVASMLTGVLNVQADDPTFQYEFLRAGKKLTINQSTLHLDDSLDNKLESVDIALPKDVRLIVDTPDGWEKLESSGSVTYVLKSNKQIDTIRQFLKSLVFEVNTESPAQIGINLNTTRIVPRNHEDGTTHYYKFVPGNYNWYESYNLAQKETYNSLKGYLMTVTSQEENDFIMASLEMRPGWLGGTRQTKLDGSFINRDSNISETYDDYSMAGDEWYWADGPESGTIFSKGKTGGVAIPGVYSKWASGEPNNSIGYYSASRPGEPNNTEESSLQWGKSVSSGTWNDLSPLFINSSSWIQGYFVEFSEYGGQTIKPEAIAGASYVAKIPQKVSLKYYDTDDNALPGKEIVLDEELMIGKSYDLTSQLPDIPGYVIDSSRSTGITGTITDQVINAKAVYRSRTVTEHADAEIKLNEDLGSLSFINIDTSATMEFEDVTLNGNEQTVREKSPLAHIRVDDSRRYKIKGWDVLAKYKDDGFSKHNFKLDLNPVSTNTLTLNRVTL